jgi:Protein of unknown function (DUF3137)
MSAMPAAAPPSETRAESEARLRAWFDREVQPLLQQHGAAVMRLERWGLYPLGLCLLLIFGLVPCFFAAMEWGWLWPPFTVLALVIPTSAVYAARLPLYTAGAVAFRALFKRRVVSQLVAEILPGARYDSDLQLPSSVLDASGLFGPHGGGGDDLVRGTVGRTPFALGDVCAGNGHGSGRQGSFQGLVFHAEFNRSLAGRTVVCPQGESPAAGALNDTLAPTTLESPEFEAVFSVYASDPVEARYVLTPKMMERLVSLRHLSGKNLTAAFDHRRVYVAIDNGQGAFEALACAGEKAWAEIRGYAALFDTARLIVEELELNTRIWTKGFAPEEERRAADVFAPSDWTRANELGEYFRASRADLPFTLDDPPAPPAHTRIERRPDGGLVARYRGAQGAAFVLLLLATVAGIASVDLGWWAARPELSGLGEVGLLIRQHMGILSLLGASIAGTALYHANVRTRWVEAGPKGLRRAGLGLVSSFPRPRIERVFAAEDMVMAKIEGSWIPTLFSPRLRSRGAALWLAAEIETALNGETK